MSWGCIGECWCPDCQQVLNGNGCMCVPCCDKPGHKSCVHHIPDGLHQLRTYGNKTPHRHRFKYVNGWMVGRDDDEKGWIDFPPRDTSKSPMEMRFSESARSVFYISPSVFRVEQILPNESEGSGI